MNVYPAITLLALMGIACPAFAQYCNPSDSNYYFCAQQEQWKKDEEERKKAQAAAEEMQRVRDEADADRERRSAPQRAEQARQNADNDAAIKVLRAKLLASPPLPPGRNPLLGSWRVDESGAQPRARDDLSQLMGMLSNPGATMCEVVFGGGIIEFKPESWASSDSAGNDSLGLIQYRLRGKQVFALPAQGIPLLGFDFVNKNRIHEVRMQDCALVRVGAQPAAASAPRAPVPTSSAATTRAARIPIDPNSPLGQGVRLHGEKDFQPALQHLLVAAQKDPNDPRAYVYLADTYAWLGMTAESNHAAERAKRLDPDAFDILRTGTPRQDKWR
jgi:tetratricopeptide (TPR) repeat protein